MTNLLISGPVSSWDIFMGTGRGEVKGNPVPTIGETRTLGINRTTRVLWRGDERRRKRRRWRRGGGPIRGRLRRGKRKTKGK